LKIGRQLAVDSPDVRDGSLREQSLPASEMDRSQSAIMHGITPGAASPVTTSNLIEHDEELALLDHSNDGDLVAQSWRVETKKARSHYSVRMTSFNDLILQVDRFTLFRGNRLSEDHHALVRSKKEMSLFLETELKHAGFLESRERPAVTSQREAVFLDEEEIVQSDFLPSYEIMAGVSEIPYSDFINTNFSNPFQSLEYQQSPSNLR
jgi:hypothetical protein